MGMTDADIAFEIALEDLHNNVVMDAARLAQCIYLFVEGKSEERAFPILLKSAGIDLEELGVVIAPYDGCANLVNSLRLMQRTLSHDRPIIATIDNDKDGARVISKYQNSNCKNELISIFPIPTHKKVKYDNGHVGGSFEEIFSPAHFLDCCFNKEIMAQKLLSRKKEFKKLFDKKSPWYPQVKAFCAKYRDYSFESKKASLAELLADKCKSPPKSIIKLAVLISDIRIQNPIKHPLDVELPKIPGLTC